MKRLFTLVSLGLLITSCTKAENKKLVFIDSARADVIVERADDGRNLNAYSDQNLFDLYLDDLDEKVKSHRAVVTDIRSEADMILRVNTFYIQEEMHRDWEDGIEFNLSDLTMSMKYTLHQVEEDVPADFIAYIETHDCVTEGGKDKYGKERDPKVNRTSFSEICNKNVAKVKDKLKTVAKN